MDKKQTAVEWLEYQLPGELFFSEGNQNILKQAKQMEKEQTHEFADQQCRKFARWLNEEMFLDFASKDAFTAFKAQQKEKEEKK